MFRRTLLTSAAVTAALGMTGCFAAITVNEAEQQDVIGDVTLTSKACDFPLLWALLGGGVVNRSDVRGIDPDLDGCPRADDLRQFASLDVPVTVPHQLLAAYRIPEGTDAPEEIEAEIDYIPYDEFYDLDDIFNDGRGRPAPEDPPRIESARITFEQRDEYEDQLPDYVDADREHGDDELLDSDHEIAGYVSQVVPGVIVGEAEIVGTFGLPDGDAADQPFDGPFNSLAMTGWRMAVRDGGDDLSSDEAALIAFFELGGGVPLIPFRAGDLRGGADEFDALRPGRPVECETSVRPDRAERMSLRTGRGVAERLNRGGLGGDLTDCGYPLPTLEQWQDDRDISFNEVLEGLDEDTRDLRVIPGEGYGVQGGSTSVPFGLRTHGDAGDMLPWTATTTVPGVAPQAGSVAFPATGETPNPITIDIPAGTAPGTYAVTLTIGEPHVAQTATSSLLVVPREDEQQVQGSGNPPAERQEVGMNPDGTVNFPMTGPGGTQQGMVLTMKSSVATGARAAATKPRLLRITKKRSFKTKTGQSTTATLKLFPKAQKAVKKGKAIKAIFVTRKNGKGTPTVRRIVIKQR